MSWWCSLLMSALGACLGVGAPEPPQSLLAAPAAPRGDPQSRSGAVWPLSPTPEVARPFEAPPQPWAAGHRGADLRGGSGQEVRAAVAGRVVFSGVIAGRGVVSVEHSNGWRTTYQPLGARAAVGTAVRPGTVIGRLGSAGSHCAPAACLHWGLIVAADQYRDPLTLLGARRPVILLPLP